MLGGRSLTRTIMYTKEQILGGLSLFLFECSYKNKSQIRDATENFIREYGYTQEVLSTVIYMLVAARDEAQPPSRDINTLLYVACRIADLLAEGRSVYGLRLCFKSNHYYGMMVHTLILRVDKAVFIHLEIPLFLFQLAGDTGVICFSESYTLHYPTEYLLSFSQNNKRERITTTSHT